VPREHGVILFLIAFVAVSLPFAWGYMLANIGACVIQWAPSLASAWLPR
jgi:hypothetical protein